MQPEVTIIEVGPRDGLQNEPGFLATEDKVFFINLLSASGLSNIEITSLVSAKAIPQLADAAKVFTEIIKPHGVKFSVLIPNEQGMHQAMSLGVKHIALFTSVSETFNQHNIHCSIEESLLRFKPVMACAQQNKISVRAYVSCALGCPYLGNIAPEALIPIIEKLLIMGVDEISLGDTIGVATPKQTKELLVALQPHVPLNNIAMHFHDTYGQAIANIYAALNYGVHKFDSSVAGLGGCPYAPGASGNVATEDVLYLLHGLGIYTGIDLNRLVSAGNWICKRLNKENKSKVAQATTDFKTTIA